MAATDFTEITTPGFAIELLPDTNLGSAMLIVEDEEGHYEPAGIVRTISEAHEIASNDLQRRQRLLEADEDPGMCPYEYKLWARGLWGTHHIAATWNVSELQA